MRLRIALGMLISGFARHHSLKLLEHVGRNIRVPILGNDHRCGRMRHEEITEAIADATLGHGLVNLGSDIDEIKPLWGLNFELDHGLKLTLKSGAILLARGLIAPALLPGR